jgi:preprotein translocase subunit SecG
MDYILKPLSSTSAKWLEKVEALKSTAKIHPVITLAFSPVKCYYNAIIPTRRSTLMTTGHWIVGILLMVSALVMIVTVLLQSSERTGIGAVSGAAETFFGKNKARGMEAKLALVTKICTGIFVCLSIVLMFLG